MLVLVLPVQVVLSICTYMLVQRESVCTLTVSGTDQYLSLKVRICVDYFVHLRTKLRLVSDWVFISTYKSTRTGGLRRK